MGKKQRRMSSKKIQCNPGLHWGGFVQFVHSFQTKKKRLEIRSGILEIIAVMFYTVVSLEVCYPSCMGVVWGWNMQNRD
jgi:hypothetical protein